MAKQRKPKQSLEVSLAKLKGDLPAVTQEDYKISLIKALNWYNVNWEDKDYRKAAEKYIKKVGLKDYAYAVSKASFNEIRSIGAMANIALLDQHLEIEQIEDLCTRLEDIKKKYIKAPAVVATRNNVVVISVQDRILGAAREHVGEIEGVLDDYLTSGETDFTGKGYLLTNEISGAVAKKISELIQPRLNEYTEALNSKDPQIKEAYSYIRKPFLKKLIAFVEQIIADCNQQTVSARAQRKPRARKAKPASVIVKKMKYMKEFVDLNLKSVEASKIIGSSELWVYHTTNRKMTVFHGADGGYLGVSGMSITNYDVAKSETKTIRKPEEFFKGLTSTGKRAMANAWKALRAKVSKPRARINEEMILFAVN